MVSFLSFSTSDWEKIHLLAQQEKLWPDKYVTKLIQDSIKTLRRPKSSKHNWEIYSLLDSNGIFYIGMTSHPNLTISQLGNDLAKRRMGILHAIGEKPELKILLSNLSKEEAQKGQRRFIKLAVTRGDQLTNLVTT